MRLSPSRAASPAAPVRVIDMRKRFPRPASVVQQLRRFLRWSWRWSWKEPVRAARTYQPVFERLEGRIVPSTIKWNVATSGSWGTASNWDLVRVPTTGDDV